MNDPGVHPHEEARPERQDRRATRSALRQPARRAARRASRRRDSRATRQSDRGGERPGPGCARGCRGRGARARARSCRALSIPWIDAAVGGAPAEGQPANMSSCGRKNEHDEERAAHGASSRTPARGRASLPQPLGAVLEPQHRRGGNDTVTASPRLRPRAEDVAFAHASAIRRPRARATRSESPRKSSSSMAPATRFAPALDQAASAPARSADPDRRLRPIAAVVLTAAIRPPSVRRRAASPPATCDAPWPRAGCARPRKSATKRVRGRS